MNGCASGAVAALLLALAGCAGSTHVESAAAPGVDLAAYTSFGWLPADRGAEDASRPISIAETNLRNAIRKQLVARGYREVEWKPDFLVGFDTATQTKERASDPVRIGVGIGSWGSSVGGGVSTSVPVGPGRVTTTAETRITVRAVDPSSERELWVGSTTRNVGQGLEASVVDAAVAGLLKDFPVRRR